MSTHIVVILLLSVLCILAFILYNVKNVAKYPINHKAKYLVFSSVGDRNNVWSWISSPKKKNFDFIAYYYDDKNTPPFEADKIVKRKGLKLENFVHYLKHNNISQYEAIWVVDDDIVMDTESINKMFRLFSKYGLYLAQPSYQDGGKLSWGITQNDSKCILRYTNFVETGVPIFATKVIPILKDSFADAGTGYGVDFIWPSLLDFPEDKIAVIDAVSCDHPYAEYSAIDRVVPRHLHRVQGAELLIKYKLLPIDWQPSEECPWPEPYKPEEYSRVSSFFHRWK